MKNEFGDIVSDAFICGKCHNEYKTPDISKIKLTEIGDKNIPTNAYICWNCQNDTELKNRKKRRKEHIVNEDY